MSLSDKRHPDWKLRTEIKGWYLHDDLKKSIKNLKDIFITGKWDAEHIKDIIDKEFGKELTQNGEEVKTK